MTGSDYKVGDRVRLTRNYGNAIDPDYGHARGDLGTVVEINPRRAYPLEVRLDGSNYNHSSPTLYDEVEKIKPERRDWTDLVNRVDRLTVGASFVTVAALLGELRDALIEESYRD